MKIKFTIILSFLGFNFAYTQTSIVIGQKHLINSEVLKEEREIWIGLPTYYDSTIAYPTIYVLDAESQFDITLALTKELAANDKIPEHIVIGIPKIDGAHRFKNLTFTNTTLNSSGIEDSLLATYFSSENTGGGHDFFKHLKNEVFKIVETKFQTNGFNIFIGHSLSGYFGAYIISMESQFNAFQLYDPSIWYNNGNAITHLDESLQKGNNSNVFISTAGGGKDQQAFHMAMHDSLNFMLNEHSINSKLKVYPNENNGSVRLPSIIDGLSDLYEGYSIGYILPTDTITVKIAQNHYKAFSKKVNYVFNCPKETYRWIAFANHSQKNWEEAIKAYNLCLNSYTNDLRVSLEIAECYFELKEFRLSLNFFEKALVLDKTNASLKLKIKELKLIITKNKQD
jgi:predicted alpha/beta superfamily hydrolase